MILAFLGSFSLGSLAEVREAEFFPLHTLRWLWRRLRDVDGGGVW